jgi:hypothetical protein
MYQQAGKEGLPCCMLQLHGLMLSWLVAPLQPRYPPMLQHLHLHDVLLVWGSACT